MEKFQFIILVFLVKAVVNVNTLQCYECRDCPNGSMKDEYLVTCGAEDETSTTEQSSTNTLPASSTTEQSSTNTLPASSTTEQASTNTLPASPTTEQSSTNTLPASPTAEQSSTNTPTSSATTEVSVDDVPDVPKTIRVRRHALTEIVDLNNGCWCYGKPCACDDADDTRGFQYADAGNVTYVCVKATEKVNGTDAIGRGCSVSKIGDTEICDLLTNLFNATDCTTCAIDKCNSAYPLQHSIAILLFVVTLALFTK